MKTFSGALLMFITVCTIAQKTDYNYSPAAYKNENCSSLFAKEFLAKEITVDVVKSFLKNKLPNLRAANTDIVLNYVNESPGGKHFSFHQTYKGVEIYQAEIKLNTDRHGNIRSVFDNSEATDSWQINVANATADLRIAFERGSTTPLLFVLSIENNFEILTANGQIVYTRDMNSYLAAQDSVVSVKVFNPDPLTTAQQNYAAPYNDNNDAANTQLNAEMQTVNVTAGFNGTGFVLENQYVRVVDGDAPNIAPATSSIPQFYFDRSQSGFEDANAFYHLNTVRNHVNALGFNSANFLIDIDTHAMGGADNSAFSFMSNPPNIRYGTGGVDDAEDADVCVHEYGHFVSYNAANGSNVGSERNSLDEGFGDYLAATYSDNLSSFKRTEVFSWDGHNEFWNGRVLNTTRIYPTDIQVSIYKNGEMWSAALWDIYNEIGRAATDSLILQAHYAYAQNISMGDAAQLVLQADSDLTNGHYHCPVYSHLLQHGFVSFDPNNPCGISGVLEPYQVPVQFLQNGKSFTLLNNDKAGIEVQLLGISGQVLLMRQTADARFDFADSQLPAGIYLVVVKNQFGAKTFKWVKTL